MAASTDQIRTPETSTYDSLIDSGERLFAEFGMGSVSLREVGRHAGQRNNAVVQYHFGSKDGLVKAITERRSGMIDDRRAELMRELHAVRPELVLGELVELLVRPLAEIVTPGTERVWYLRFLANSMDAELVTSNYSVHNASVSPVMRDIRAQLAALLPDLTVEMLRRRVLWMMMTALRMLAQYERDVASGATTVEVLDQVVSDTTHVMVALLNAPVLTQY